MQASRLWRWAASKETFVDECYSSMIFHARHARRRCPVHAPTAARIIRLNAAGSGTSPPTSEPEPLPGLWPRWARHWLYWPEPMVPPSGSLGSVLVVPLFLRHTK